RVPDGVLAIERTMAGSLRTPDRTKPAIRRSIATLLVLAISLTSASASLAQEAATVAETFVVKVYRVVDLVVPAPSYPYEGTYLPAVGPATSARANRTGMGGMGGGMGGMGGGM